MEKIISLNELTDICGHFNSDTGVNNGFGCSHNECGDKDLLVKIRGQFEYVSSHNECGFIAKRMSTRKIRCNRRLAKKFIKKARAIQFDNEQLKRYGLMQAGKCFSFSCPVAYEVSFDSIYDYQNGSDYDFITTEDEMPRGWGDDLMAVDINLLA